MNLTHRYVAHKSSASSEKILQKNVKVFCCQYAFCQAFPAVATLTCNEIRNLKFDFARSDVFYLVIKKNTHKIKREPHAFKCLKWKKPSRDAKFLWGKLTDYSLFF